MGRTLSLRDYGAVMSLVSALLLVVGVGSVIQTVVAKISADLRAAGDEQRMVAFTRAIIRSSIWAASVIFVIAVMMRDALAEYLHLDRPALVVLAGGAAACGFLVLFQRGLLQGFGSFNSFAISASMDGSKAFFILPLAHGLGAVGAILAYFAAALMAASYGILALRSRLCGASDTAALDARRLFRSAGATAVASVSIVVLMFYDIILAKHYVGPEAAGLYSAAALGGRVILAACSFLPIVLLPHVALRWATGRPHRHLLGAALAIVIAIMGVTVTACALKATFVLTILAGRAFEGAAPLLLPYVVSSSALAIANLLAMYAIARHSFGFIPYVIVIAVSEIAAVTLRHASPMEIVQDILAGHVAICLAMTLWVMLSPEKSPSPAPAAAA